MKALIWAIAASSLLQGSWAQTCDSLAAWPTREQRWWQDFLTQTEAWALGSDWKESLLQIQCNTAGMASAIIARMEAAEARNDAHLSDTLQALRTEQETLRSERDAGFFGATPQEWWPALGQVLVPKRPDVLHFGVHDRMKCAVCSPAEKQAP